MHPIQNFRRSLLSALVVVVGASLLPAVVSPAAAVPTYSLTAGAVVRTSATTTFTLAASEAMPAGEYCVSVDSGVGLTSTAQSRSAGLGTTVLTFEVAVGPGNGSNAIFSAYPVVAPTTCAANTPPGATILATRVGYVAGAPTVVRLSPASSTVSVSSPAMITWTVRDSNDQVTRLGLGETVDVSSTTSATVTFNGAVQTTLSLSAASGSTFTAQNSVAETASVTAALNAGIVPVPKDTVTLVTSGSTTALAVTPSSATTQPGGTTTFTITATGANGTLLPGVSISAAVSGRNPRAASVIGTTNQAGVVTWSLTDASPASPVQQDTVTFTGNGATRSATITYSSGRMNVFPTQATTASGGTTMLTVTAFTPQGVPAPAVPVAVSSTGRNAYAARSVGLTDANGQVTWTQQDAAAGSTATTDLLTFSAGTATAQATITYPTVSVSSPVNGSRLSTGGLFGVSASTTGVPAGTLAYLTLNGNAKAVSTVQPNGAVRFDGTAVGGGQWIPSQPGTYAVRLCGGACGDSLGVSAGFQLSLIPFGISGSSRRADGRLAFSVNAGNFFSGTPIELTRNGVSVATGIVRQAGVSITIVAPQRPGTYQVRVSTPQGVAFGDHAGVVWVP